MRRREVIRLLGGAAVAWPRGGMAQQERVRRVGVLMSIADSDPEGQKRLAVFKQSMQQLGWTEGANIELIVRWGAAEPERIRKHASELVALAPDVILANGSVVVGPLLQATRTVPIIFVYVPDPVGAGYVGSLARPGGNATGFTPFEYGTASKWVELLKEISPTTTRAAVMRDPMIATGLSQFALSRPSRPRSA